MFLFYIFQIKRVRLGVNQRRHNMFYHPSKIMSNTYDTQFDDEGEEAYVWAPELKKKKGEVFRIVMW